MKVKNIIKNSLGMAIILIISNPSYASKKPLHGVKCPSGYASNYSSSSKVLKCKKVSTQYSSTICPNIPYIIYKVRRGTDKCATADVVNLPVTGPIPTGLSSKLKSVKCLALPGTSGWVLDKDKVNSGGGKKYKDRCKRTKTTYKYPVHR